VSVGFVLLHGWALDAASLAPLASLLAESGAAVATYDLGYFGAPAAPALGPVGRRIAVGHSYGYARLLASGQRFAATISLAGFTRYARTAAEPTGVSAESRARLSAALVRDAPRAVRAFRLRCGVAGDPPGVPHVARLRADLARLGAPAPPPPSVPTLALAAADDRVVEPALARACFGDRPGVRLEWRDGGHALPQNDPAGCARRILAFVETLP